MLPGTHVLDAGELKTWMAGTSPAMTASVVLTNATNVNPLRCFRWRAVPPKRGPEALAPVMVEAQGCGSHWEDFSAMLHLPYYTALVTVPAILFYSSTGYGVALARRKFGISAPATSGHPDFDRAVRVQMNTLEWMAIFMPLLWLFAFCANDIAAAALGLVWIGGRILYMVGYREAANKRGVLVSQYRASSASHCSLARDGEDCGGG